MFIRSKIINILIFVTFILGIPILFIGILKMYYLIIPGEKIGNVGDWIGFSGGYVGALLALGGIWWQIEEEKNKANVVEINTKNETLYSFLVLISNFSDNMKEISEMYLKNYFEDNSKTFFSDKLFSYNKDIFFQLVSKIDVSFYRYAIELSNLFSLLELRKSKINNEKVCLETFYCEQLEIYTILFNSIQSILENYNASSQDSILRKFNELKNQIDVIQNSYQSYFESTSKKDIKKLLIEYKIM